jgi:hypothetical protein
MVNRWWAGQWFLIVLFLSGCGNESTGPDQQEKTRMEYLWLNETISLPPGSDTCFSRGFEIHDTLHVSVGLLNPYAVSLIVVKNREDSILFSEAEVASENFSIHIPGSDSHHLVLQQNVELSRFQLYTKIIRWEYVP